MSLCKKKNEKFNIILINSLIFVLQIFFLFQILSLSSYADNISSIIQKKIDLYIVNFDQKMENFLLNEKNNLSGDIKENLFPIFDNRLENIQTNLDEDIEKIFSEVNNTKKFFSEYSYYTSYLNDVKKNLTLQKTLLFIENIKEINDLLKRILIKIENIDNQLSYLNNSFISRNTVINSNYIP